MANEEDMVVCLPTSMGNPGKFDDNIYGSCALCGVEVQWRPYMPQDVRKVCMNCAIKNLDRLEEAGEEVNAVVMPQTIKEVLEFIEEEEE